MSILINTNNMKINTTSPDKQAFTKVLINIAEKPKALYYIGKLPDSRPPTVAIVGTRRPTSYGKEVTYKLAYELAQKGIVVVSGLALGVDGIAHQAALDAGGVTLAVLASGVDNITPRSHIGLAKKIVESGGAIISEYEPGTEVRNFQFLVRNRIVSGLADAVIVTEAASRSGTLSTVSHALNQGKEVFVVPGNITSPMSTGCNALIKQGAQVVTDVSDILEVIAPDLLKPQTSLALGDNPLETKVIQLLQAGVRDGDELLAQAGVKAADFAEAITMLEINGVIRSLGGNMWTLR